MKSYFFFLLFLFTVSTIRCQEVDSLRSLALDKAADELYKQLIQAQSFKNRLSLLEKWDKLLGIVTPKNEVYQETLLERFEKRFFNNLIELKTFDRPIFAITNDSTRVVTKDDDTLAIEDIRTKKSVIKLKHPALEFAAISSDYSKAISACKQAAIVWDLNTQESISTFIFRDFEIKRRRDVALNPNNCTALCIYNDNTELMFLNLITRNPFIYLRAILA